MSILLHKPYLQGAYEKFSQIQLEIYAVYNNAILTCNTAMEREFQ